MRQSDSFFADWDPNHEIPIAWRMTQDVYERYLHLVGQLPHVDVLGLDYHNILDEIRMLPGYPLDTEKVEEGYYLKPVLIEKHSVLTNR